MSGKQTAVLWMGLILIVLNLDWGALKKILFTGGSSSGGGFKLPTIPIPLPGIGLLSTPPQNKVTVM